MNAPVPNRYDRQNAYSLCLASKSAYDNAALIKRDYGYATSIFQSFAPHDLQLFLSDDIERVVISVRGTVDLANWLTDLNCRRVPRVDLGGSGCEVHEGFSLALDALWPSLEALLRNAGAWHGKPAWFTGHSLGGALAMLAANRAFRNGYPIAGVYTFGQPRVFNATGRNAYNRLLGDCTFRLVHAEDVVARVPWLLGAYRHAGHEVFFDFAGMPHLDMPAWRKLPSDAAGALIEWRRGKIALLADHHIDTYVRLLTRSVHGNGPFEFGQSQLPLGLGGIVHA